MRLYSLGMLTSLAILIPVGIVFVVFHRPIIDTFLQGEVEPHHYFVFLVFSVLTALRTVQSAVIQGLLLVGRVVMIKTVSAGIQVVLVLTLVSQYGLIGLFYGLAISLLIAALMAFSVIHRTAKLGFSRPVLRAEETTNLAQFGGANVVLLVAALSTEYLQRFIILNQLGIEAVGLMVAAMQIIVYIDVFNRSAIFYWFAKMSKSSNAKDLLDDYAGFSQLTLIAGIPMVLGGILFGGTAIDILLGENFSELTSTLYLFMIWQFFNLIHNPPAMAIMAMARVKVHAIATLASATSVPIVMYLGMSQWSWGFESIGIALIAGGVLAYIPRVLYMGIRHQVWGTKYTWMFTFVGTGMVGIATQLRDLSLSERIAVYLLLLTILYLVTPKSERRVILETIGRPLALLRRK